MAVGKGIEKFKEAYGDNVTFEKSKDYKIQVDLTKSKLTNAWMQTFSMWKGEPSAKDSVINGQNYLDNNFTVGKSTQAPAQILPIRLEGDVQLGIVTEKWLTIPLGF